MLGLNKFKMFDTFTIFNTVVLLRLHRKNSSVSLVKLSNLWKILEQILVLGFGCGSTANRQTPVKATVRELILIPRKSRWWQ